MITKLTEEERAVWKDAYMLHEHMHDMTGTDAEWESSLRLLSRSADKYTGATRELAKALFLAVYDHMSDRVKALQDDARNQPEQITMEGIPWT